mmetsp:Transcript_19642/g.29524  ORF Transcript_19642/g.29524 Transcript_19642/m.29524 type:complete len:522 (-) Transcript_19642:17-1582(-)
MAKSRRLSVVFVTLLLSCCFLYDCHGYHAIPNPTAKRKASSKSNNLSFPTPLKQPSLSQPPPPDNTSTSSSSSSSSSSSFLGWKSTPLRFLLRDNNPEKSITANDKTWGAGLAFFIVLYLAFASVTVDDGVANLADVTLPTDSTQVVSGAMGEAIAGIVGALAAGLTQKTFAFLMKSETIVPGLVTRKMTNLEGEEEQHQQDNDVLTEGVANSDYFIASSASRPLLEAVGVPLEFVSIASVIFAAIPYELTKLTGRARTQRQRKQQQLLLQQLEEEELSKRRETAIKIPKLSFNLPSSVKPKTTDTTVSSIATTDSNNNSTMIDVVEIFADVTKWLEYNVLMTEFGESLMLEGERSSTGALLGFIAAISTQIYADVLYGYFQYGPEWRREEISGRSTADWVAAYIPRAVSSAALFGVYEYTQPPVSRYIQGVLAGGVDGCLGSQDFDMCLQTYIDTNAPGPTAEAQVRALVTNLLMVAQRIQDVAGDTSQADIEALIRAWTVSFLSYAQNHPPPFLGWFGS